MKFSLQSIFKLILSLSVGFALIWFLQKDLTTDDKNIIKESIKNANIFIVFIVSMLAILAVIFRALRWKMMLKSMDYKPNILLLILLIFILYLCNLIFPRLGEVLRCSLLQKYGDIPIEKSLGTMITERIIDMLGMGIIAFLALVLEYDKILAIYQSYQAEKGDSNMTLYILIFGIIILPIIIFAIPKARNFIISKVKGVWEGVMSVRNLENPALFIGYSIALYSTYLIATYITYFAIEGTHHLSFQSSLVTITAGTLGIGLTQGGIGAFQLLVSQALEMYDIPKNIGLSYAWVSWLIQTNILVLLGMISWLYLNFFYGKKEK